MLFHSNLLILLLTCAIINNASSSSLSSSLMELDEKQWYSILKSYDIKSSYATCRDIPSSHTTSSFITIFNDKPATIIIAATNGDDGGGKGRRRKGTFDVKFKDSIYIFDQFIDFNEYPCIIIPPYQPVEWINFGFNDDVNVCSYEGMT